MVAQLTLEIGYNISVLRCGTERTHATGIMIFVAGVLTEDLISAWALKDVVGGAYSHFEVANAMLTTIKFIAFLLVMLGGCCYVCKGKHGLDEDADEDWCQAEVGCDGCNCKAWTMGIMLMYGLIAAGTLAAVLIQDLVAYFSDEEREADRGFYSMFLGFGIFLMWILGMMCTLSHWCNKRRNRTRGQAMFVI